VRAYTQAAQVGLSSLKTERKIAKSTLGIELPYPIYEKIVRLIQKYEGEIEDETFASNITLIFNMPQKNLAEFQRFLTDLTAGRITAILLS
jgi:putative IMPACT (imprinted ancient) family translation regulator